jgi:hypothetical protein
MGTILLEFQNFLESTCLKTSDIHEDDTILEIKKNSCTEEEIGILVNYDFNGIFDLFSSSITIRIFNSDALKSIYIKKGFDKGYVSEEVEDMIETYKTADIELLVVKESFKEQLINRFEQLESLNTKVYFKLDNFYKLFKGSSLLNLETQLFKKNSKTVVLILEDNLLAYNNLFLLVGGTYIPQINSIIKEKFCKDIDTEKLEEIVRLRNELCYWHDATKWLSPDYIYINFKNDDFVYQKDFEYMILSKTTDLIIPYIADYTAIDDTNNELYSIINGYKKVRIPYEKNEKYDFNQVEYLYSIYKWIYDDKNADRISIARNIITILLCGECQGSYYNVLLTNSYNIYKSITKNFDIYLKNNVKEYFEERHKIREMITNKSKDISYQINALIENMTKSFLTSIGVVLIAGLGYLSKGNIYILKVSAIAYGLFIFFNAALTSPYYFFRVKEVIKDYDEHIDAFKKILLPQDIPNNGVNGSKIRFYWYWGASIVINIFILILTLYSIFNTKVLIDMLKKI